MSQKQNFQLLAKYNQWINEKVFAASEKLDSAVLCEDNGAFFKSIIGTLNHILVADIFWLKRFADHPHKFESLDYVRGITKPDELTDFLFDSLEQLRQARSKMDTMIIAFLDEVTEEDLESVLSYTNVKGDQFKRKLSWLVMHLFNHQTHHRGQVTTLLFQHGIDVGVTDLPVILPTLGQDGE
jgi:uncharacterized damage-inducible protein DinB